VLEASVPMLAGGRMEVTIPQAVLGKAYKVVKEE